MIQDIISFLNQRIEALPYFSQVYGLSELRSYDDSKKSPVVYNNGKWEPIKFTNLGTTYWRKDSDVSYSQGESFTSGSQTHLATFALRLVAITTRSEFPDDDNYSTERLATSFVKAITLTGGNLKRLIRAQQLLIRPTSYITDDESIKEAEFPGLETRNFKEKDIAVSIVFEFTITTKNLCLEDACNFEFSDSEPIVKVPVPGPEGPPGPQGETGPQGDPGPAGPQGETGPQGEVGPQGETGPVGPQGEVGATGPTGAQGPEGPQGIQGETGDIGPEGPQGVQGLQGDEGQVGATGAQGIAGNDGADGLSAYQIWINEGNSGTEQDFLDSLVGPEGPQGVQGNEGPQGVQGDQGLQGDEGPIGPAGATGPQGDEGPQGIQGNAGSTGPQGPAGADGVDGQTSISQSETFEESAALSTSTNSGFQWGVGNGDQISQNGGVPLAFSGSIRKLYFFIFEGSATVELYINGVATGQTISASGTNAKTVLDLAFPVSESDLVNFRTTAASGNTNGGNVGFLALSTDAPIGFSINDAIDVDTSGIQDGQGVIWSLANNRFEPGNAGGVDQDEAVSIAAGSTLGLQQSLLANDGQPALTVLAVGYTTSGKVQGCSLGDGNVVEVYANGSDFNNGVVLYREFMSLGEPIVFTGLSNGAIITATQGFYGVSEQVDGGDESPMPLLSYGLSFTSTFFFAFRNCQVYSPGGTGGNQGWVHVVNGPLDSEVTLKFGNGSVVQGQENIALAPWTYLRLYTDGNTEYIIESTNPVMACHNANMDLNPEGRFYDSRLIMPLTNDGITWPRSGNVSAPFDNTIVNFFVRDNAEGQINGTTGVSPGSPIDFDANPPIGTGANDADYEPDGATRVLAVGLISAYSGADSAGLEASPLMPTSAMSQVVPIPWGIQDGGDGGDSGIAIASPYEGTAKVYSWNDVTKSLDLEYTVPLTRNGVTITSKEDQKHPAAGSVANDSVNGVVTLVGNLLPGVVIADVPITVVTQTISSIGGNLRSQNGTTASQIVQNDDETLMLGWTPPTLKAEITEGADGILYKRVLNAGADTWVVA